MRVKDGLIEVRLTLEPDIYESIVEYLNSEDPFEISTFIEEVVMSYVEMQSDLIKEGENER